MPPATSLIVEEVSGVVERASGHGFLITGRDGWLNVSKYADPAPPIPGEGARVRVGLDKAGFVRAVEVEAEPEVAVRHVAEQTISYGDRDTRIMRQAVLNTATAILGSAGRAVEPEDVLDLASRLEAWVTR